MLQFMVLVTAVYSDTFLSFNDSPTWIHILVLTLLVDVLATLWSK